MSVLELLDQFSGVAKKALPALVKANAASRDELIDVTSELAAELQDGLQLVGIYLRGARHIDDRKEMAKYFLEAEKQLLRYHSEFKVCRGLHKLRDRFNRLLDPLPASITIGEKKAIETLLYELAKDERMIIDEFHGLWPRLVSAAGSPDRNKLPALLDEEIERLQQRRDRIGKVARTIIESI